jgi:hypothetical protein
MGSCGSVMSVKDDVIKEAIVFLRFDARVAFAANEKFRDGN